MDVLISIFSSKLNHYPDDKIMGDKFIDLILNSIPELSDGSIENLSLFIDMCIGDFLYVESWKI